MGLHVCHVLDSLSQGGLEYQVLRLIESTDDEVTFTVCHFGGDRRLEPEYADAGAAVVNLDSGGGFGLSHANPRSLWALVRVARSGNVDILHAHTSLLGQTAIRVVGRIANATVVGTFHNRSDAFHPVARVAERLTRGLSAVDIAVSKGVERSFAGSAAEYETTLPTLDRRTYTIYNGIDVTAFEKRVRAARTRDPDDGVVFLNVGRYTPVKGQSTLIRAMANVIEEFPDARLQLVGWGEMEQELKRLANELGLEDHVDVTGRVPSVDEYYANADVFVLPSSTEGLSVVLLEAMTARLPIVATDIPGTREAVVAGETGELVPVGAVEALSDALCRVAVPHTRKRMGERGYTRVTEKFAIERMAESYQDLYHRVG